MCVNLAFPRRGSNSQPRHRSASDGGGIAGIVEPRQSELRRPELTVEMSKGEKTGMLVGLQCARGPFSAAVRKASLVLSGVLCLLGVFSFGVIRAHALQELVHDL